MNWGSVKKRLKKMTACIGAGISVMVVAMAVFMIARSTKQLNQLKQEKEIAV